VSRFTAVITGRRPARCLAGCPVPGLTLEELLAECRELDDFRRSCDNLYERVRALFFLYAIHRFHIPLLSGAAERRAHPLCRL
jgi:hypothetical protein